MPLHGQRREARMRGFGSLNSAKDLLKKLEADFEGLRAAPTDTYLAYNFFVTAEHMLDWLFPGDVGTEGPSDRAKERKSQVLLQVVSNLANGAKHFEPNPERHDTVSHVDESGSSFGEGSFGVGPYGGGLIVTLENKAAEQFGPSVSALSLAERMLEYWRSHPRLEFAAHDSFI